MRRLFTRLATLGGLSVVVLALAAAPAGAHHALLSGVASCPGADHVIDWTIGNSQPKEAMTITSAAVTLDGTPETVSGYVSPVAPAGSTSAQTTLSGALTGTVTLTVDGQWTDGHVSSRHVDVALTTPCAVTTTTLPTSTTVQGGSTTSEPGGGSTTSVAATVPPSSAPPGPPLAYTGASITAASVVGCSVLAAGLALCFVPGRRKKVARKH